MAERITMNVDDTLELDYLVEQVSDDAIGVSSEPNNVSTSIDYISTKTGIFNPPDTGTYQLNINDQTIKIEVTDIPNGIVDDFENSDLSEYPFNQGNDWSVVDGGLIDGSNHHIQRTGTSSGQSGPQIHSVPGDGLPRYPVKGNTIEYYFQDKTGSQAEFRFGTLNSNEESSGGYELEHGNKNNNFTMIFIDGNDNFSTLFSNSLTWNQNHTYRVEIEWGDTITATAFDHDGDGSEVVTDSTPDKTDLDAHNKNGGISFSDNGPVNSNSCAFDNLSVR